MNNIEKTENSIRKIISAGLKSSTAHGIPNIVKNKHTIIKLIWIICLLISTSIGGYLTFKMVLSYLNYEVVSNIQLVSEERSEFPTISICYYWGFNDHFYSKWSD